MIRPDLTPAEWAMLGRMRRDDVVATWSNRSMVKMMHLRLVTDAVLFLPSGKRATTKRWSIAEDGIIALDVRAAEAERD